MCLYADIQTKRHPLTTGIFGMLCNLLEYAATAMMTRWLVRKLSDHMRGQLQGLKHETLTMK